MLSLKKYMSFLWDDCQWEKLLHIAEKWPTGHGTLFYPLVRTHPTTLLAQLDRVDFDGVDVWAMR